MTAVGVILGILILIGSVVFFFYFGYDFLHNYLDLNIFFSIIILVILWIIIPKIISDNTKQNSKNTRKVTLYSFKNKDYKSEHTSYITKIWRGNQQPSGDLFLKINVSRQRNIHLNKCLVLVAIVGLWFAYQNRSSQQVEETVIYK